MSVPSDPPEITTRTAGQPRISKRMRFEILRRDGFRCRYCGKTAAESELEVDHVLALTLGGRTESENLTTACVDCNAGKSSTAPSPETVAEVDGMAQTWAAAIAQAAGELIPDRWEIDAFEEYWKTWGVGDGPGRYRVPLPANWFVSIERFLRLGLPLRELTRLAEVTMVNETLIHRARWKYFCGCCWRRLDAIQQRAQEIVVGDGFTQEDYEHLLEGGE